MSKNLFKKLNEEFFSKCKRTIKWFDKQGLFVMSDNRVVTITLDDVGTRNYFNGYLVEIINNRNGGIVKKFFRFQDHLTMVHREDTSKYYHIWLSENNTKLEWYISKPKDTKEMCDVIFEWIDTFQ